MPLADSILPVRLASGFTQDGLSGGSFQMGASVLAISAWNNGCVFASSRRAMGKKSAYASGSASINRLAIRSGSSLA